MHFLGKQTADSSVFHHSRVQAPWFSITSVSGSFDMRNSYFCPFLNSSRQSSSHF